MTDFENHSIGIDLGGTNIKAVLLDRQGVQLEKRQCATEDGNEKEVWKTQISQWVTELGSLVPHQKIPIGIAAPGLADEQNAKISFMPSRMLGLEGFEWRAFLQNEDVFVLNDAHAALIAEHSLGVGKGLNNLVMLTLGTGVGGAVLIEGKLYQGMLQRAGHLGHLPVNSTMGLDIANTPDSLELAIGSATVIKRTYGQYQNNQELVKGYESREPLASYCWLESIKQLAAGLSGLINSFSPEAVILGGGTTAAKEALFLPLRAFMKIYEWRPKGHKTPILHAHFANWSGAIGAATFALSNQTH